MASFPRDDNRIAVIGGKSSATGLAIPFHAFVVGSINAQAVAIVDGSGSQITSFGGGTQYPNGQAQATPTGTVALGYDGANVRAIKTDSSGNQTVMQQDSTSTGVINSTESISIALNGASSLGIILEGGFGGQVNFEASIDGGTNWFTANALSTPGDGLQQNAGNSGQFVAPVAGFSHFRCRGNTVTGSACTVFMRASAGASNRIMNNAVINTNVQNFGIGQFGGSDGMNKDLTSAVMWNGGFYFNGASWDRQRGPTIFKVLALTAATAETTIWTPTSGKKFRLMGFLLTVGAASTLTFKDNTAGTTIFAARGTTDQPIHCPPLGNGILSGAANNVLTVTRGTSATLDGVVFGTEE